MRPVDYSLLTEKRCSTCQVVKPVAAFTRYSDPTAPMTGWRYHSRCRLCANEASRRYGTDNKARRNQRLKKWRRDNPEAARAKDKAAKRASYGITRAEEEAAYAKHDGLCWLCLARPARVRDHDHRTGLFRGVLCHGCNTVTVARADADPEYLKRVGEYLDQPCHADVLLEVANL